MEGFNARLRTSSPTPRTRPCLFACVFDVDGDGLVDQLYPRRPSLGSVVVGGYSSVGFDRGATRTSAPRRVTPPGLGE